MLEMGADTLMIEHFGAHHKGYEAHVQTSILCPPHFLSPLSNPKHPSILPQLLQI